MQTVANGNGAHPTTNGTPGSRTARDVASTLFVRYLRGANHPMKRYVERGLGQLLGFDRDITAAGIAGVRFHLRPSDLVQREILKYGAYERVSLDLMKRLLRAGDVMVDVGGHVGQYALHASQAVGERGRVIAFEPNPRTYGVLQENLALNGVTNVTAIPCAVGAELAVVPMVDPGEADGGQTRFAAEGARGTVFHVPALPLSLVLPQLGVDRVRVLKIDVEGAEPVVLSSLNLHGVLRPEHILFEFLPELIVEQGHDPYAPLDMLREAGYRLRTVLGDDFEFGAPLPDYNIWADGTATTRARDDDGPA